MSKGAYYQGLLSQQGIATTGPDFGQISDKFTEKILAVKANQTAADKIAYQKLKDAADAKNKFLKEQRDLGSELFKRDDFDGTGIGELDKMIEKSKAAFQSEMELNNAMYDYIGEDGIRKKNNNLSTGMYATYGLIEGAQQFMNKKFELEKQGRGSFYDDLVVDYAAELATNAKIETDALSQVYISSIVEGDEQVRSVPMSTANSLFAKNSVGVDLNEITNQIISRQEKGKRVFQKGTTEYTKYTQWVANGSSGSYDISPEAKELINTSIVGLSYDQKIDALHDLQMFGKSFIVTQDEYDKMSEKERADKIVITTKNLFDQSNEKEIERLLSIGLSHKMLNEVMLMESQEQVDPRTGDTDKSEAILAPVGLKFNPVIEGEKLDANAIIDIMGVAGGTTYDRATKISDTNTKKLNPDLYSGENFNANAKVSAVSIPSKINDNELRSLGISSSSKNQWANITGFVTVDLVDDKGNNRLDSKYNLLKSIRIIGSVSSKKITTKTEGTKGSISSTSQQTQQEELVTDISPSLSDSQLISAFNMFSGKNKAFKDAYQTILTSLKQNDASFSENDPEDVKHAISETIQYFNKK